MRRLAPSTQYPMRRARSAAAPPAPGETWRLAATPLAILSLLLLAPGATETGLPPILEPGPSARAAALAVLQRTDGPRVLSVTPSGEEVPVGRQIVLQFDRAMVPIGRMERTASEIPVSISPPLSCEWRWLNTSALACQLSEGDAFAPATRYTLAVAQELRDSDGNRLTEELRHEFATVRPAVQSAHFRAWKGPGTPEIYLNTNQDVPPASLSAHLTFVPVDGEPVAAELRPPEEARDPSLDGMRWLVSPRTPLPADTAVHLRVAAGLASAQGPLASRDDAIAVEFWTFPEPNFLGIRCTDNDGHRLDLRPQDSGRGDRRCDPQRGVALRFASPILVEIVGDHLTVEPDLAGDRDDYDPWDGVYSYSRLWGPRRQGQLYPVHLPEVLQARKEYRLHGSAASFEDEFGRPLAEDIDFRFYTDDRRPRAVLTHGISVLEGEVPTHVPLFVTNLVSVDARYDLLTSSGMTRSSSSLPVPEARNVAFAIPLQVRDWLDDRSGALFAHLGTQPSTGPLRLFSQVTPFAVHAKLGHRNTAVWVTDLASGEPVPGARVRLYVDGHVGLVAEPMALAEGTSDGTGVALLAGTDTVDPELDYRGWLYLDGDERNRLFVRVDKGKDLAILPLVGNFEVRAEGPNNSWIPNWNRRRFGHVKAWGTTAQGVYRLGDTVQYKIYVRDQDGHRFVPPPRSEWTLQVHDPMDKLVHEEENIELNSFGAWHGELVVPQTGAVGFYRFTLDASFLDPLEPMRVLVADFTPAPFRTTTDLDGELFAPGDDLHVRSRARLHSGGPYGNAQTRLTVTLRSLPITSDNPKASGFYFESGNRQSTTLHQMVESLDGGGDLATTVPLTHTEIANGRLVVETAVRDDRGKFVAGSASARYVGRDRFAGIRQADWLLESGSPATVEAVVLEPSDRLASGDEILTRVEYRDTKASRVKGAGNAYLTQYVHEWIEVARCNDAADADRPTTCSFTPERSGLYRLSASVADSEGRRHSSTLHRWATGKGHALWETPPGHHLPIEPEQGEYKVGDVARFLIRNPFPGGRALLSVERLGVQHQWSRILDTSTEVIEIDVTPDHLPGFYFSAVVASPRVEPPPSGDATRPSGEIDLGKPAFRMGYVRVPVRDPFKMIDVEVTPRQETYRPRQRVTVDFTAAARHAPPTGESSEIELAVAVLDEAVFDLIDGGDEAFDPYRGFYDLEPLDLRNFNLLTHLIGIRKFDKKGASSGGGGGAGPDLRSVFKFVSYWNPSLRPDSEGKTSIEFEVPDNLTGWRVLAMAVTPGDRMGLGQGRFAVNQPIELRPALPNQVTEGDRFDARFTVMNRTADRRRLTLHASLTGPAESPGLAGVEIDAEPFQRYPASFPVKATTPGTMDLTVWVTSDTDERDALRLPLEVRRKAALVTAASYGTTVESHVEEEVAFPADMRPDVGELGVTLSPSVLGALEGAFSYARDYPYYCWEQRLTKGVMASHYARLRPYTSDDFTWPGHEELPRATLEQAANFQAPNGGMVYWIASDEYASPYLSAYTAISFNWLRAHGHEIPAPVEEKLHDYLARLLRSDVFPGFYSRGMSSSVRAVALAALAPSGKVDVGDLDRYRRHVTGMDLFGKAHYLLAGVELGAEEEILRDVRDAILAHANQSGGKFTFTESVDTAFSRILHSAPRSNCAILSALVADQGGAPSGGTGIGDVPFRLTRSLTQGRQRRDHWQNTQENMFCMQALIDYSNAYEADRPDMTVRVAVGGKRLGRARFEDVRDPAVELARDIGRKDPGKETTVRLDKEGAGRLYYATRLTYSPLELSTEPTNSGIEIRREYSAERDGNWVLLEHPMQIRGGELVRVDLYVSVPAARNFVVVDDPVPGGLEPVNRELATASVVDADKGERPRSGASYFWSRDDWYAFGSSRWSFYHRELRHDSARFFSDYLPAGNYHLAYTAQAIAPGEFAVLPAKAEEMYDPDVFGLGIPSSLEVGERLEPR